MPEIIVAVIFRASVIALTGLLLSLYYKALKKHKETKKR